MVIAAVFFIFVYRTIQFLLSQSTCTKEFPLCSSPAYFRRLNSRILRLRAMKRISILNFKGGVGKTSISTNAAHKLALLGHKVLLIDCDIQHNASNLIPLKDRKPKTLTHFIKGEATFEDTIQKARENLYLIASDRNLDKAQNHIVIEGIKGYKLLRNATRSLNGF